MILTILGTVILCTIVQLIISHTDKCIRLILELSRLSLMKKYIPVFNNLMERYYGYYGYDSNFRTVWGNSGSSYPTACCLPSKVLTDIDDKDHKDPVLDMLNKMNFDAKPKSFKDLLKAYEDTNNTKVIFINHKKSDGLYGIGFLASQQTLTVHDADQFIDIMRDNAVGEDTDITLIINTPGGSMTAAEIITHSLLTHKGRVSTYIPYYAMSAGTMIALASNEIYMDKNAYCGTVDPQMCGFSVTDLIKYCSEYSGSTSIVGDIARLFLKQATASMDRIKDLINRIRNQKSLEFDTDLVVDELVSGKYNHDKPLFAEDMAKILPNVKIGIPSDVMELYKSFNGSCKY